MVALGVAFYPEHWPEDRLPVDIRMLKESGVGLVRMAEFSWSKMEPSEGVYDMDWLQRVVRKLGDNGIKTVLGTPTAAAPPWLVKRYPDVLPVDCDGSRASYGVWRQYCPNNPAYRASTAKIVGRLAGAFKGEPSVVGYQVDNEFHWGEAPPWKYCYCEHCLAGFRQYLAAKYAGMETLNEVWGTAFWSHHYNEWNEISPPVFPFDVYNRGLALDWVRFRSKCFVDYLDLQIDIIKKADPEKLVTTNLMALGAFPEVDYFDLCRRLDFVSTDVYPKAAVDDYNPASIAMQYASSRGMSKDGNFWVFELQAGPADGHGVLAFDGLKVSRIGVTPAKGEMRKWFYQAVAHGSKGNLFFNWRTNNRGKEQYWHGILDHSGLPNRRFEEVKQIGKELRAAGDKLDGLSSHSRIAVLMSYDSLWAADVIERGYYPVSYLDQARIAYEGFWRLGMSTDVISTGHDLSRYDVVIAPFLYLADEKLLSKIRGYVRKGGFFLATARSFVKDEHNRVRLDPLPGPISDVFGATVSEYARLPATEKNCFMKVKPNDLVPSGRTRCNAWIDVLQVTGDARAIGSYEYGPYKGEPALVANDFGRGKAVMVGTFPDEGWFESLAARFRARFPLAKGKVSVSGRPGVELVEAGGEALYLINHSSKEQKVRIVNRGCRISSMIGGKTFGGRTVDLSIQPNGVEILSLT